MSRKRRILRVVLLFVGVAGALELFGWCVHPGRRATTWVTDAMAFANELYVPDTDLVVRLRPSLQVPVDPARPELGIVSTNAAGHRGAEWEGPDAAAFRVVTFGDSVTFGLGVADDESWPTQLDRALAAAAGDRRVQVRNFGVPGYSSFMSRQLFERHVVVDADGFAPHVVVFASGFNDAYHSEMTDRERHAITSSAVSSGIARGVYELRRASRFVDWFLSRGETRVSQSPRVSPDEFVDNASYVASTCAERGIGLVLVDSNLISTYPTGPMADAASASNADFVAMRQLLGTHLGLPRLGAWAAGGPLRVVVETHGVALPASPDDRPDLYALWVHDARDRLGRTRVALRDDGSAGDVVAGDGRFSALVEVSAGARPEFAFGIPGLGAEHQAMTDDTRLLNGAYCVQPAPAPADDGVTTVLVVAPNLPPWPQLVLPGDSAHLSATGCAIVGRGIAQRVLALDAWTTWAR